jgi:uncharacterized protein (TIGR00369 family)
MPFTRLLGLEVVRAEAERVVLRGAWAPERCTTAGILHGGYLMAAVDSAGAMCAFYNLPEGARGTSTIESKTNFLGAVRAGAVTIEAQPLQVGRTVIVVQTDATDEDGRRVSRSIQTQAVFWPRVATSL